MAFIIYTQPKRILYCVTWYLLHGLSGECPSLRGNLEEKSFVLHIPLVFRRSEYEKNPVKMLIPIIIEPSRKGRT